MLTRRAPALAAALTLLVSVVSFTGCNGKAPGHQTSRSRWHNLVVSNRSNDETVYVNIGDGRSAVGSMGDGSDGTDLDALWDSDDDDTAFFWIVPGTWHVTLDGDSHSIDCGTITFTADSVVELTYE